MKKVIFGLSVLGSALLFNGNVKAQGYLPGDDGNSFGGVCC
jgi:hypothetical protein